MKGFFTVGSFKRNWPGTFLNAVLLLAFMGSFAVLSAQKTKPAQVSPPAVGHLSVKDWRFEKDGLYHGFNPDDEILEKRDAYSKHFRNNKGSITAIISQAQMHYQTPDSKVWEDIGTTIKNNTTGKYTNYNYAVPENIYQLYFSQSLDNGFMLHFGTGDLEMGMKGEMRVLDAGNNVISKQSRNQANGTVNGTKMTFGNTYPSGYDELKVTTVGVAHDIVLSQKPAALNNSSAATLGFREFVKLPAGWKIVTSVGPVSAAGGNPANGLAVIDNTGKQVSELLEPVIEEQNARLVPHDGPKGHSIETTHMTIRGEFSVEYADGGAYIETRVPAAWLNDPDRQYPVVIDPTVNCYTPSTCGYDGTSTSSTACYGTTVSYCGDYVWWEGTGNYTGWMYFSTSNIITSEIITDVAVSYDVYAVDYPYFNINNAATYTTNCSTIGGYEYSGTSLSYQTFSSTSGAGWYSADLGSGGVADLQAALSAGTYGVAFYDVDGTTTYYANAYGFYYGGGVSPYLTVTYNNPNSGACVGNTNGYGVYIATITPTCSSQTVNMPSTSYVQWTATAGVTYNFSLSASGWGSDNMVVYDYNGSSWVPALSAVLSLSIAPTSTMLANSSTLLISAYNGTGCPPTWYNGSAVLTYQIAPATTPAISDGGLSQQCYGANVTYTASGITVGSFNQFILTNSVTGVTYGSTNPYTWTPTPAGSTESVVAQSINGGCTANSSPLSLTVNAISSTGSFASTLYSCGSGSTYTTSGVLTAQTITGITGSVLGWGYGNTAGNCSANTTAFPTSAGSTTAPWTTIPGGNSELMVEVQNGACSPAQSCYQVVANTMSAPSTATITPSGPVCTPTSGNITLSYSGGGSTYLPATLTWYSGSCGGTVIGTGQNLVIAAPSSTTTYYCAYVDPCGGLSGCASATFTVTALPTVSAASYSICKNSTTTLSPSSGGTWVSNNTSVATVSGNTVTGVGAGTATFTFTSSTAPYCANTTSAITVTALPVVSITGPTSFCGGGLATTTLSPTSGGTWVSNNTAVATVSGYTVTGTTAGGSTNFTFTSSTSPNCANTTANVTVTGLPTVYGVTGGGTYCYGSSSVVGLAGSQTGVTYQLQVGGVNVGSPVAGTGSAISFGGQTAVGTYTVVATTTTNTCSQAMSGSAVVNMLTPNVTNSPGATSIGTNGATMNGTD